MSAHARKVIPIIKPYLLPTISLLIYLVLAVYLKTILPPGTDIYSVSAEFFRSYGYLLVFIGALLESALIIDLLVPGGSVILAAAFFTSQGILSYPIFFVVAFCGAFIGFLLDYIIGYYSGFKLVSWLGLNDQLKTIEERVNKWGIKAFLLGYVHPDLGSLYAISAGVLHLNILNFSLYSAASICIWGLFWSLPIYFFGNLIKIYLQQYIALALILIILAIFLPKIISKLLKHDDVNNQSGLGLEKEIIK